MIHLNGKEITDSHFPNGELNILKIQEAMDLKRGNEPHHFVLKYVNDSDLMALYFAKKHIDDKEQSECNLSMYYCPYSRMDRAETPETPFMLKYFASFINDMNFKEVEVYEPHSEVTIDLLNNVSKEDIVLTLLPDVLDEINFDFTSDFIVYPDETAFKRYGKVDIENKLVAKKKREFSTGRILDLVIEGEVKSSKFNALLVDDLCSKGGTFLLNAQKLKELGADKIYLLTGHCENTVFDGELFSSGLIEKMFTTNSILTNYNNWENRIHKNKLTVYDMGI